MSNLSMRVWNQDIVRFMLDASDKSNYFNELAKIVAQKTQGAKNICDCGCGLGQLSLALSSYFDKVYGIDVSENAIKVFKEHYCKAENIVPIQADFFDYQVQDKFESLVFNHFGNIEQIVKLSNKLCKGKVVVIKKDYDFHRFSLGQKPLDKSYNISMPEYLDSLGIKYEQEHISLEFGQPFRSAQDAVTFFRLYSKDENWQDIQYSDIQDRLVETEDPVFPYYMPHMKKLRVVSFDV